MNTLLCRQVMKGSYWFDSAISFIIGIEWDFDSIRTMHYSHTCALDTNTVQRSNENCCLRPHEEMVTGRDQEDMAASKGQWDVVTSRNRTGAEQPRRLLIGPMWRHGLAGNGSRE